MTHCELITIVLTIQNQNQSLLSHHITSKVGEKLACAGLNLQLKDIEEKTIKCINNMTNDKCKYGT